MDKMEKRLHDFAKMLDLDNSPYPIIEERAGDITRFSGLGSVFYDGTERTEFVLRSDARGKFVERIMDTAFDEDLRNNSEIVMLWNHSWDHPLARRSAGTVSFSKRSNGLGYDMQYLDYHPRHQMLQADIRAKNVTGSSFGFLVPKGGDQIRVQSGVRIREIHQVKLIEVSPVTMPAYSATSVGMRSIMGDTTEAEESFRRFEQNRRLEIARQKTT